MKALSFRQPWAELVLQGRKTMDLRTYTTHYRGPLAIHASQTVEADNARQQGLDPAGLDSGAIVGTVELVDVIPLDEAAYEQHRDEHLAGRGYREGMVGWLLARPERLPQPIPARGRTTLFNVDLEAPAGPTGRRSAGPPPAPRPAQRADEAGDPASLNGTTAEKPFALHVEALAGATTDYALVLRQRIVERPEAQPRLETVITVGGDNLRAVADHVIEALRKAEYKATDLAASRRKPFYLPEEVGCDSGSSS